MVAVQTVLTMGVIYLAAGLVFALLFQWRGLTRLDPAANGVSWSFRLIIMPGLVLLWPMVLRIWRRSLMLAPCEPRSAQALRRWHRAIWLVLAPLALAGLLLLLWFRPAPVHSLIDRAGNPSAEVGR